MLLPRVLGRICVVAAFTVSGVAQADVAADLARAKRAFDEVANFEAERVNRLAPARRREIWSRYYDLLAHYGRMTAHHEMMTRHGLDREQAFASAEGRFLRALAQLQALLNEDLE